MSWSFGMGHPTWIQVSAGETLKMQIVQTGYQVKGRLVLTGREGDLIKQPLYAILASDLSSVSATTADLNSKQLNGPFFDPGRLILEPNGKFESHNPITPGTYLLFGKIDDVRLDQPIEVPSSLESVFANLGNVLGTVEAPVIDLGDIAVIRKENTGSKQQ